jgi:hypothetical protein
VSLLCILQFVWTVVHENVTGAALAAAVVAVLAMMAAFRLLYCLGHGQSALEDRLEGALPAATPILEIATEEA